MLFNSLTFVVFIVFTFTLYWLPLTKNKIHQNIVLLVSSYIFYGWWDYRFLSLILFSSIVDFFIGKAIHKEKNLKRKKSYLIFSLITNLGLLFVFKYFNFFIESFFTAFSVEQSQFLFKIILPVGISFYTFQTLSYTIDIYRNQLKPTKSILNFLTFVSFFPQLVAGPIERAAKFLPQIQKSRVFSYANAVIGCRFILYGMFKKVVIADNLAEIVNIIFTVDSPYSGIMNILGVTLFAIQIYCDFSGYSDIAIGVAKLFNIDLMTNFKRPYFSTSLAEFWSKWHISLSSWFRDYMYIPLGGNKFSKLLTIRNLFLTFLISGLWHGANWTFVIWGSIHGVFIIFEKFVLNKLKLIKPLKYIFTLSIVLLAWIFFRAESFDHSINYLSSSFEFNTSIISQFKTLFDGHSELTVGHFLIVLTLSFLFILIEFSIEKGYFIMLFNKYKGLRISLYVVLIHMIFLFGSFQNASDFIYFQF
jgi:D-alanyl-lipoteichoic acid acyltransferase DltB (MBOAT superfamily)